MTDQPQFTWREPNTPLAELAPGQISYCDAPEGKTGVFVVLRTFDGLGKGPLDFSGGSNSDGQIHLSSRMHG